MKKTKVYSHSKKYNMLLLIILLLIMSTFMLVPPDKVNASDNSPSEVIKVGYYITPGFQEYNEQTGEYDGYSYEYLLAIAQYTGWKYEFVPVSNSQAMTMLENGEIDIVNNVSYNKQRSKIYEFSEMPSGENYACMVMLPQREEEVAFEEYSKFNDLTVAIVEGRSYTDAFSDYCKEYNCNPQIVYCDTSEEARNMWLNGEVDAYVGTSTYNMDYHVIAKFHHENYYIAMTKGNTELKKQLDSAMNSLNTEMPYFESNLYTKYYSNMAENNCVLNDEEKEYIKENKTIKVIYDKGEYPISYQNDNAEFAGAMRDIYDLIQKKTGLHFEYIACNSNVEDAAKMAGGDDYIICEIPYDYKWALDMGIYLTKPFTSISCMKVSNDNAEDGGTMAVVDGYYIGKLCKETYGDKYQYVTYPDTLSCINAVKDGEADCTCMTSYEYEYYSSQSKFRSLYYKVANKIEYQLAIAVGENVEYEIKSIMEKSLNAISIDEIQDIFRKTTLTVQKPDLLTFIYQYPNVVYPLVGIVAVFLIIIAFVCVTRYFARKNQKILAKKNEQLKGAIEQANTANQSKSQFLAQMSHEIRTPMNAVVGMTAMAQKSVYNPEKTKEYLTKIDTSSKMLLNIINDILDMSAIENNKLKIASEVFDIKRILTGITTIYYGQCKEKGINFETKIMDLEHEMLIGDSLRVNQVLMNLVSNAYKFTAPGGNIKFQIFERKHSEEKIYIEFIIEDDGCGMSDDLKKRLFHAFEQENASTAKKHGGSGLGLAITKNLVDMMEGAIEVESQISKGTKFIVNIPFKTAPNAVKADNESLKGLNALVVDDDKDVIEYTCDILERMGVCYDTAQDGESALKLIMEYKAKNKYYDACLIDWKMPGMDGIELTHNIRSNVVDETIVIIVSAYDLSEVEDDAKAAGANLYLEKPFFQSTLFNILLSAKQRHIEDKTAEEQTSYDFTGHKVLLAEDFELNVEVALDLLDEVNLKADVANNGAQAVKMLEQSEPGTYELILMDIQMPEMDGLEATRVIRKSKHPQAKIIPIYAMTANAFNEDIAAALNAGMNGHIAKPIDTDILYKILHKEILLKE